MRADCGRFGIRAGFSAALPAAYAQKPVTSAPREGQKPLPMKPDAPGQPRNHRLILKDGTYQMVRQYTLAGDRVRYLSLERGEWEEMPADLVDWAATEKWERDHTLRHPELSLRRA